jgi:threonine/homoserine/homoserine lactone efflux protein
VLDELPRVVLYALVACLSPVSFSAALMVLRSARPRINGLLFASGFVVGTCIACLIGFLAGAAVAEAVDAHQTVSELLELALGVFLLVFARRYEPGHARPKAEHSGRQKLLDRLERIHPATALTVGAALGIGGPKRLTVTLLATASISAAVSDHFEEAALVALYAVIATAVVWIPVGIFVFVGSRLDPTIARTRAWIERHRRGLQLWISLVLGVGLCLDASIRLL